MKLFDIVKWDDTDASSNDIVVYRHEAEDFNTKTQLIVQDNQEAVFFKDGMSLDCFPAGRHTLSTKNIPLLGKFVKWVTGGETPFTAKVYFVNKVRMTDLLWGTPAPIPFRVMVDSVPVFLHLRAFGLFGIHIENAKKFLRLLNGTRELYAKEDIEQILKGKLIEKVSTLLGEAINKNGVDIFNMASYYTMLSDTIYEQMVPYFDEYGIKLDLFSFDSINIPEEDMDDLKKAQSMDVESAALARKRAREGYTYGMEKGFEVMGTAAANEGMAGTFMGAGMGLGMGVGMGGAFGTGMTNIAQNTMGNMMQQPAQNVQQAEEKCPDCGAVVAPGAKFCNSCGKKLGNFCPQCGAVITAGAKFCTECGTKLASVCPSCKAELPLGAKFCTECGTKI